MKILSVLLLLFASASFAGPISREEALKSAFPGAQIQSDVIFLTEAEKNEAKKNAGTEYTTALVARYTARQQGKEIGRAYLDTHTVRTKKESLLVILSPDGSLKRVEVVAFLEPPEYIPGERWYRQFDGQTLDENLKIDRDIHAVTGATLTAKATTDSVRRMMAIDSILRKRKSKP